MRRFLFTRKSFSFAIFIFSAVFCLTNAVHGQEDELPKDAAPPPLKVLSKEEKRQLDEETNIKKRTQLSLDLMETRLKSAETLIAQDKFQETINDLGSFQALLENAMNFLEQKDTGGSKTDYNYKRLEIGLRRTIARLELIRRELPYKYGFYVERLQKHVREARAKAVEPLFGDTVIPDRKP